MDSLIKKQKKLFVPLLIVGAMFMVSIALMYSTNASALNDSCGVETTILDCPNTVNDSGKVDESGLWGILLIAVGILTAGVGVAALAGIVYGVILYTSSQGEPAGIKKAIEVIRNVVIGVVAYALMWSALNWLVPGGVFN